ncbi:MAG: glycoside hydrolase [Bacteroidetes bacterium]|nr:glycoside hydrolase [Bacteroidota bacterium]
MIFNVAVISILFSQIISGQSISEKAYSDMHWRLVGPYRAGWATMAEGIPDSLNTFYFGGAGGGIWKTSDAGRTWKPFMQHESASSIGALAVSLSNSNIIYAGTGQVALRYDMLSGNGVFRSDDAGNTWKNIGLKSTKYIGRILVDPKNPDRVLVAALGNVFSPTNDRGIYLTNDGGEKWQQVLFVNDSTGGVDLASDPTNPSIIYAALWQIHIHPWLDYFDPQTNSGSGIYKSEDGGEHWKKLTGNGIPESSLGRIGLAVARGSEGKIVYATIISSDGKSGLYRSDDAGQTWQFVNKDGALANSYFSRVTVDPKNPDKVYVMGRSISKSTDGGKHFTFFKGAPGGDDYHFLWINPSNSNYMITGSDQGAVVTVNRGKSWSSWYNQPTGQFYHIAVDNQFPYHIYSGQQDNGTVDIASRGPNGVIEDRDWQPVGGDERDYDVPKPDNPNIVFGSGLGGPISKFDDITHQSGDVSPWPISTYGALPLGIKYRYSWVTPLVISPVKPHPMYFASQYLFKSTDDGNHWKIISPDLTGADKGIKDCKNPDLVQAEKCGYGVIWSINPSPISNNIIWIGTDDGLIQLTTNGGKSWKNVTPPSVPLWSRIDAIDPSYTDPHTAYAAVNTHRLGYASPLIFKTNDNGMTWQKIINGLPDDEFINAVRVDPVQKNLLYAATNRSVYVSFNDGADWQPLSLNFPTTCVNDIVVHDNDLIAGTQGRGIWILDDVEPLREISSELISEPVHLFKPAEAIRIRGNENHDTPWPPETPLGQNPPNGAIIDYWLKDNATGPVTLTIKDTKGNIVREFSSEEKNVKLPSNRYFEKGWIKEPQTLSGNAGMHRFVWNLRYNRPPALRYGYSIAAVWTDGTPLNPEGVLVLPGRYTATLKVDGKTYIQQFDIKLDPRVHVSAADLKKQFDFAQTIYSDLLNAFKIHEKINSIIKKNSSSEEVDSLTTLANNGEINFASEIGGLSGLINTVEEADAAPTQGELDVYKMYKDQQNDLMNRWKRIEGTLNQ